MKRIKGEPLLIKEPDNKAGDPLFPFHLQAAVLLALSQRGQLTPAQYEACMRNLEDKYGFSAEP